MRLKTIVIIALFAFANFLVPSVVSASTLSPVQIQSIIGLLEAFHVDTATLAQVQQILSPTSTPVVSSPTPVPYVSPVGSAYIPGTIGYDLSSHTYNYPQLPFNFAVVGATGGKAFVHNSRVYSEYSWAQFGGTRPTMYMNINAPYGSTVAGHTSTPKFVRLRQHLQAPNQQRVKVITMATTRRWILLRMQKTIT